MTRRSATWTPEALIPASTRRRTRRHAAGASRLVTTRAPRFMAVPSARPRRKRGLGRQIDVRQAADPLAGEERRGRLTLPDDVVVDLRARLDLLERVDPHAGRDDRLVPDRRLVADRGALLDARVGPDVAHPPDDRALHARARGDVGPRVDDRTGRSRALADRHARREHRVRVDGRVRVDAAVVADERRAVDRLEVAELDPLPHPHVPAQADPRDVQADLAVERVEVRLPVLVEVPDVLPVAVGRRSRTSACPSRAGAGRAPWRSRTAGRSARSRAPRARSRRCPC